MFPLSSTCPSTYDFYLEEHHKWQTRAQQSQISRNTKGGLCIAFSLDLAACNSHKGSVKSRQPKWMVLSHLLGFGETRGIWAPGQMRKLEARGISLQEGFLFSCGHWPKGSVQTHPRNYSLLLLIDCQWHCSLIKGSQYNTASCEVYLTTVWKLSASKPPAGRSMGAQLR